jgi:hypothetical protein
MYTFCDPVCWLLITIFPHKDIPNLRSHIKQSAITGGYLRDEVGKRCQLFYADGKVSTEIAQETLSTVSIIMIVFLNDDDIATDISFTLSIWALVSRSLRGAGYDLYFGRRDIIVRVEPQGRIYMYEDDAASFKWRNVPRRPCYIPFQIS